MSEQEAIIFDEEELPESAEELDREDLVPAGVHDVVIEAVKLDESGKKPAIVLRMRIEGGAADGEAIFHRVSPPSRDEKAGTRRSRLLMLRAIGAITEEDFKRGGAKVNWSALVKVEATVEVEHREYEGRTFANVTFGGFHKRGWRPEAGDAESGATAAAPAALDVNSI